MSRITALQTQKRRPDRVSVFVDGAFAIGLSAATARDLRLAVGQELAAEDFRALGAAAETDRAYDRALKYLAARRRSRREVATRLRRYGYGAEVIEPILQLLEEQGYVDDAEFAAAWIRDRLRLRPKGRRALRTELAAKGVARDVVEAALEANLDQTEEEMARRALAPRRETLRAKGEPKGRAAILAFLARRGFDAALARRLAQEVFSA